MIRFRFCVLLLVFVACARETPRSRDVILITIDTLRADALGFRGNTRVKTPFLDSLAARGVVFTRAHAHNVVTLPSHANILTGLYPWQHGIRDNAGFTLDPKHATLAMLLRDRGYATGAFVSAFPLDSRFGLDHGFDVYDDAYRATGSPLDFAVQERSGSETLSVAQQWWDTNAAKPRFLWVHLYEPHAPYANGGYYGEVSATDAMLANTIGPLLAASPDAMVIVTADHGEALGDHGEETHGLFAYESTLAVPLIVVDGARPHAVDDRWVRHIDIAPTILERAGVEKPAAMKGLSLFAQGERGHSYFEALSASLNRGWAPLVGVLDDGKKLIELPLPELYDIASDPKEAANRFRDDRRTVVALRDLLKADAPTPASGRQSISEDQQANLLSLGYLSGTTSSKKTFTTADDPKNLVELDNQLHRSIAAYQQGDLTKAIALARSLVDQRPDMQIAQEMLAFFLGQNARPEEAIALLQRQVAAGQANDTMRIRLGLLLSEAGRAREALELLRPYADRDDPDLLNAYGIALADNGDVPAAVRQFERILAADANNARALQNLGIVALRAGDVPRARGYLERALAIDNRLPLAWNTLGVAAARSNDFDGAIAHWTKAVDIDPSQLDALYNLGVVAAERGRRDIARKALSDYLERAPAVGFAEERATAKSILATL